jgi:hypothetical protein
MADPQRPEDIRKTEDREGPRTGSGSGAAYRGGYGAGGLSAGADRLSHGQSAQNATPWDAPGVTPDGRRTGSSLDGPRIAVDGEGEPDPDLSDDRS